MSFLLTMNLIQVLCSKSTVNYQLKTLEIVKFVTFLSQNANDCSYVLPQTPPPYHYSQGTSSSELCFICEKQWKCGRDLFNQNLDRSDRESGLLQKVDQFFFRKFSGWTEPIHWVLDRNFRKFWLKGLRPRLSSTWSRLYV